jgi:hypothetical protein
VFARLCLRSTPLHYSLPSVRCSRHTCMTRFRQLCPPCLSHAGRVGRRLPGSLSHSTGVRPEPSLLNERTISDLDDSAKIIATRSWLSYLPCSLSRARVRASANKITAFSPFASGEVSDIFDQKNGRCSKFPPSNVTTPLGNPIVCESV